MNNCWEYFIGRFFIIYVWRYRCCRYSSLNGKTFRFIGR